MLIRRDAGYSVVGPSRTHAVAFPVAGLYVFASWRKGNARSRLDICNVHAACGDSFFRVTEGK